MKSPARLTVRAADRDMVAHDRLDLVTAGEHHMLCPVCGQESLVVRPVDGRPALFCEALCSFERIRDCFPPDQSKQFLPAQPVVRLYQDFIQPDQCVLMKSWLSAHVENRLYVRKHRFGSEVESRFAGPFNTWKAAFDARRSVVHSAALRIPLGWVPVVRRLLERRGLRVEVVGHHPMLPKPLGHEWLPGTAKWLQFIQGHRRGTVRLAVKQIRFASLVASVAKSWPDQRIVVIARAAQQAERLRAELLSVLPDVGLVTGRDSLDLDSHLIIVEADSRGINLMQASIVMVLDATLLTRNGLYESLLRTAGARLYGFLPAGRELRPFEEDRITSLLGFTNLTLIAHRQEKDHPVTVMTVANTSGVNLSGARTLAEVKRWGIWRNARRNRIVAQAAVKLKRQLEEEREETADRDWPTWLVGVVVENVEHARRLESLLPGWIIASDDELKKLQSKTDVPSGVVGVIVTMHSRRMKRFSGIVRADGGTGLMIAPNCVNVNTSGIMSIVDIVDRHHPRLRRNSQGRIQAYTRAGLSVNGIADEADPVQRFLADHPSLQDRK